MAGATQGYQVGSQCFTSKTQATDFVMSQVVPVIKSDGTFINPIYKSSHWEIGNNKVEMQFPECKPLEQFEDGLILGIEIVALMFIAFIIKTAIRLFKFAGYDKDEKEE